MRNKLNDKIVFIESEISFLNETIRTKDFNDIYVKKAVKSTFFEISNSIIDCYKIICSNEEFETSDDTYYAILEALNEHDIVLDEHLKPANKMIGFRNRTGHEYEGFDYSVIENNFSNMIFDIENICKDIKKYIDKSK